MTEASSKESNLGPISEKFKDFNIIPPYFAHRFRWNVRETVRQTYSSNFEHLFSELNYLEYLFRQYQRGGKKVEASCETHDSS